MIEYLGVVLALADLFRVLGDEDRLRLLALCAEEELTVGELATLLGESQPQITKKTQLLREIGLLASRRDGARTLLKVESPTHAVDDPIIGAAIIEGRALCHKDGSFAKIARVIAQREDLSRQLFEHAAAGEPVPLPADAALLAWLPLLAPLLPGRALAIDLGTGDGSLLPVLSPLYDRVVAVDRSAARLARCAERIAAWGLPNVRLRESSDDDPGLAEEIGQRGGADLVVMARVLHHVGRPQDAIRSATRLLRDGGHLAIIDYVPHDDESLREHGHVWLGFEPQKLMGWIEAAQLRPLVAQPFAGGSTSAGTPALQLAVGRKPARALA